VANNSSLQTGHASFEDTLTYALSRDPLHAQARHHWETLRGAGAKLHTSVPTLACEPRDLEHCWEYFRRADLHRLSALDATSFVIMKRARIRLAFTFDRHFSIVGFRLVA